MRTYLIPCAAPLLLLVLVLPCLANDADPAVPGSGVAPASSPLAGTNPCPEGQFRDYSASTSSVVCRALDRNLGFDWAAFNAAFPDNVQTLATCSYTALQTLLNQVGTAGGGTVRIPAACTITVGTSLVVHDNTILEGGGMGSTIINGPAGFNLDLISVTKSENIILRDLTLDGQGTVNTPLFILYSRNVLVERLEITRAEFNGLNFAYSQNVTIRYSISHDTVTNNGLASKDCYPDQAASFAGVSEDDVTEAICEAYIQARADLRYSDGVVPGAVWTTNYAVYSNHSYNNTNDNCMALHATNGEVAGSWMEDCRRGIKTPDAQNVWIHHNLIEDVTLFALHVYAFIKDRPPRNIRIYTNLVRNNGDFVARIEGAQQVFLLNNILVNNNRCYEACALDGSTPIPMGTNALRLTDVLKGSTLLEPDAYVCTGSLDMEAYVAGLTNANVRDENGQLVVYSFNTASEAECGGPLPVELLSFEVDPARDGALLRWETASEQDNAGFEIQQQTFVDAPDAWSAWTPVAFIDGHGTTSTPQTYRYRIEGLAAGLYRFRLKQLDLDGAFSLSAELEATINLPSTHTLSAFYPNPFNPSTVVALTVATGQHVRAEVYDLAGRRLQILLDDELAALARRTLTFDAGGLPSGLYVLRVTGESFSDARTVLLAK